MGSERVGLEFADIRPPSAGFKRMVRSYSVTPGMWIRGLFAENHGVAPDRMTCARVRRRRGQPAPKIPSPCVYFLVASSSTFFSSASSRLIAAFAFTKSK
jgi:hypothetical protein